MTDRFMRMSEVLQLTTLSRSTLWRLAKAGKFPEAVQITPGRVGWKASEVAAWQEHPEKWSKKKVA
ncbi:helix-turn-helix transcriptional regulator [Pseudomonas sp. NPDC078700]|uniref:helix-turn-helix transcriptional regulator n=1 Tax=Pseudomonas sp. NPDC078700 TaxID=3364424 RepID=UPI0037C6C7F1